MKRRIPIVITKKSDTICFIGLTLPSNIQFDGDNDVTTVKLTESLNGLVYKNRYIVTKTPPHEPPAEIQLNTYEKWRFINALKKVRDDKIYYSYNDDFGYHAENSTAHCRYPPPQQSQSTPTILTAPHHTAPAARAAGSEGGTSPT